MLEKGVGKENKQLLARPRIGFALREAYETMGQAGKKRQRSGLMAWCEMKKKLSESSPPPLSWWTTGSQVCYNLVNFLQRDEQDKQGRIDYLKSLAEGEAKEVCVRARTRVLRYCCGRKLPRCLQGRSFPSLIECKLLASTRAKPFVHKPCWQSCSTTGLWPMRSLEAAHR